MNHWELSILDWIRNTLGCPFLDAVMPWISRPVDNGILWIALAALLLCLRRTRRTGVSMAAALLMGLLLGNLLMKPLIARIRPYDLAEVSLLIDRLRDYSFPSGHTLASFEAATVLLLRKRSVGIPAMVFAVLVAFSRLYLYVHYPTDVLAGALLGAGLGLLACRLTDAAWARWGKQTQS